MVEDEQGRHRLYLEPPADPWVLVDVDLDELDPSGELPGDLFEGGADHAAGAAPGGPEIDHDGCGGVVGDLGKSSSLASTIQGRGCLQWPHLGRPSAATGIRLPRPQFGQVTVVVRVVFTPPSLPGPPPAGRR
jgi:hypothetical protein